ncbi:MAG: hypothetical protein KGQ38_06880, partial [Actinomycetales bacterium]|nr:hypothetical protein [Actinomycetales bacterium]
VICHWNAMTSRNTENVIQVIGQIVEANLGIGSLLVLARYKNNLPDPVAIKKVWKSSEVTFSTIHSAKGLEADYVVVCDVYADSRGFPSIIEDDPVMNLVMDFATDFPNDEERRIFYVAITRARKECHLITPAESPSDFALELREFNGVEHRGIEEPVLCHKCLEGTLVMNTFLGSYCCTNYPLCTLRNPVCPICNEFGQLTELDPVHYSCKKHGDVFTSCPSCDFGTISRRYVGTTEFWNCHLWVETNCPGKY